MTDRTVDEIIRISFKIFQEREMVREVTSEIRLAVYCYVMGTWGFITLFSFYVCVKTSIIKKFFN